MAEGESGGMQAVSFEPLAEHSELQSHASIKAIVDKARQAATMLKLEAQVIDAEDASGRREKIAGIHDRIFQIEQDVVLLEQIAIHHKGYGDVEGIYVSEDAMRDLSSRYSDLNELEIGYDTIYVNKRLMRNLEFDPENGTPGYADEVPQKTGDEFAAMSPTLQKSYREVRVLKKIATPIKEERYDPILDAPQPPAEVPQSVAEPSATAQVLERLEEAA